MVVPTRLNTTMTRVPPRPVSRGAPVGAGRVPAGVCVMRPVLLPGSGFFFVPMPFLLYPLAGAKYGAFPGSGASVFRGGIVENLPCSLRTVFRVSVSVAPWCLSPRSCRHFTSSPAAAANTPCSRGKHDWYVLVLATVEDPAGSFGENHRACG